MGSLRPVPSHEPDGYVCPFCALLAGRPREAPLPEDVVAETERAVAFVSPRWWPRNPGHVLVVPRTHVESLTLVDRNDLHAVADLVQRVTIALREATGCPGTSVRQHDGPAGGQDVWHLHVHVFPRWPDDDLYRSDPVPGWAPVEERVRHAERLARALR